MNQPSPFNKNANKSNVRSFSFGRSPVVNQTGVKGQILEVGAKHQATKFNPNPNAPKALDWWDEEKTRPKEQVMILLQTELNDGPDDEGNPDDGRRKLFVTVEYKPKGQMAAIMDAMAKVGAEDIELGANLALWFIGYDPESANPDNPRRLFQANYARPAAAAGAFQASQQPTGYDQAYGQPQGNPQQHAAGGGGFGGPPQQQAQPPQQGNPLFAAGPQQSAPPQQAAQPPVFGGGVEFTTSGPVDTGTGELAPPQQQSYPAPQPAAGPPNVEQIRQLLANGWTDAQISGETGAPLETINAIRNIR